MADPQPHSSAWLRTRSEAGPDLKLFRVRFDWLVNPRNGHEQKMTLLEGGHAVQIIARTAEEKIVLVEQYRVGIGQYTFELPGGLIDPGESPLTAAKRELAEETGYTAAAWRSLGRHAANPVFMTGWIHHFAAEKLKLTQAQSLDPAEQIKLHFLPLAEVKEWLRLGRFVHPHTVCALHAYLY
ncbi:MAG: NUDIX hydrolase [Bacteroidetes bacterium]|nr:MAG: NUDIX hydrolase [Bacteroidota bacterium]